MASRELFLAFYSSVFKSIWTLIFARFYAPQQVSKRDLTGQIAIVTGGNSGIGLCIATQLTRQGATVYLACRSIVRGAKAIDEIVSKVGEKSRDRLHCSMLDTGDLSSVRSFCSRWAAKGNKIDMLIHNAGIAEAPANTADSTNLILTTNFYSSFLMTHLLLPDLAHDARVVMTSSSGHYSAPRLLQPPLPPRGTPSRLANLKNTIWTKLNLTPSSAPDYAHSKGQQVLFAHLLQGMFDRDSDTRRSAHAFTPGFTSTPIFSKIEQSWRTWLTNPFFMLLKVTERTIAIDPEQGARTGVLLAAEGGKVEGGKYWEWGNRRTSLVEYLKGYYGEEEFAKRARAEWKGWEEKAGERWEVDI